MRRSLGLILISVCGFVGIGLVAQGQQDFAGRWTTDPVTTAPDPAAQAGAARGGAGQRGGTGRGSARGDLGSGWGSTITLTQDATRLTVEYAFFTRGDMQPPMKLVYPLDSSETKNTVMMGRGMQVQTSTATWSGSTLVITTRHTFANPETGKPATTDVIQRLTLESPASLVVETIRGGVLGGPESTSRTVYRKL